MPFETVAAIKGYTNSCDLVKCWGIKEVDTRPFLSEQLEGISLRGRDVMRFSR